MNLTLKLIPKADLSLWWPMLAQFYEVAYKEANVTEYGLEETYGFLSSGQWVAVGVFDENGTMQGALAITLHMYPHERVAFVTAIGGHTITSKGTWSQLKTICRSFGAGKLQGYSRESVARLWKRLGFKNRAILVEAAL